ncbi:hypothetical protein PUMCH_000243 [Australozyma saopauloensis]|uniref:Transmembrane protein n=1 Tax=Australozyma saopauloensis TaxID=291208 RepID=A0AAX4H380_9ASCO|nr:hypothetical protein PUMCH_000243 [[Candida] saopauloensis]
MKKLLAKNFFSREPLNYETLTRRCTEFHARAEPSLQAIMDYINANRKLQTRTRQTDQRAHFSSIIKDPESLGIKLGVSKAALEQELWVFMKRYWLHCISDEAVVKMYLLESHSANINQEFQLVVQNYRHRLALKLKEQDDLSSSVVSSYTRVLLKRDDFANCFKLLDVTYSHPKLLALKKAHVWLLAAKMSLGSIGFASLGWGCIALLSSNLSIPGILVGFCLSAITSCLTIIGLKTRCLHDLDRVSWRPYVLLGYRYLYREASAIINQIVNYYEEHNDLNTKIYHLRQEYQTSPNKMNGELEILQPIDDLQNTGYSHAENEALLNSALIRSELAKRKLMWNSLKEEKKFLEFWMNHGENFEWVEPDQDPGEIIQRMHDTNNGNHV